jgi:hypothetical protein
LKNALALVKVDSAAPFVIQGFQLLYACVSALEAIGAVIERVPSGTGSS